MARPKGTPKTAPISFSARVGTKQRLDEFRRQKPGFNLSAALDTKLSEIIDGELDPEKASLIARLRFEATETLGTLYREGYQEGERWAREEASWIDICEYAGGSRADISVGITFSGHGTEISGNSRFMPPPEYLRKEFLGRFTTSSSPAENRGLSQDVNRFFKGWIDAVNKTYEAVKEDPILAQHETNPILAKRRAARRLREERFDEWIAEMNDQLEDEEGSPIEQLPG